MPELAYVNGKILPIQQAVVPVDDRGYQFGDAVYEFIASYDGRLFELAAHLDRLERSLADLYFHPIDRDSIKNAILTTYEQAGIDRAGVYLQISRGVAPRNHLFPNNTPPQIIITVRSAVEMPDDLRAAGAKIILVEDIRWKRCDIKTVQLLPNTLAKQQAMEAGADDAIFVSARDVVREATSSNLFMVRNGVLVTHPLSPRILPGITRQVLISICGRHGIPVTEKTFSSKALLAADEAFLSGTVTEVLPIATIDGQVIGDGKPGSLTCQLFRLFRELAEAH